MLSKQNLIHIATDVVLISVLFMYINNKNKSLSNEIEEVRTYTEDQLESINSKLETLIKVVSRHDKTLKQLKSPQLVQPSQSISPQQSEIPRINMFTPPSTPSLQPQQFKQNTQQPLTETPTIRKVKFQEDVEHLNHNLDQIMNSMAPTIVFSATSMSMQPNEMKQNITNSKIEVVQDDDSVSEENNTIEEEELNELDLEEIEAALGTTPTNKTPYETKDKDE
jgi:hypothetical protein